MQNPSKRDPDDYWSDHKILVDIANFRTVVTYSTNSMTGMVNVPTVKFEDVPNDLVKQMTAAGDEAFAVYIDEVVTDAITDNEGTGWEFTEGIRPCDCWGVMESGVAA